MRERLGSVILNPLLLFNSLLFSRHVVIIVIVINKTEVIVCCLQCHLWSVLMLFIYIDQYPQLSATISVPLYKQLSTAVNSRKPLKVHFCQAQPKPQPANPQLGAEIALFSQLWGTTIHQHQHPTPGIVVLPVWGLLIKTAGTCSWLVNNLFTTCLWPAYNLFTSFS